MRPRPPSLLYPPPSPSPPSCVCQERREGCSFGCDWSVGADAAGRVRNLYNTVLFGRIILTWFPNPPQVIAGPLSTLADPYLNLFRGIIPPLGGTLDLSPILAFFVLNIFTNSAAALPCEVGPDGEPVKPPPSGAERAALFVRSRAGHVFRRRRGPGGGSGIAGVR